MPLTEQEKRDIVVQNGYNPDQWSYDENRDGFVFGGPSRIAQPSLQLNTNIPKIPAPSSNDSPLQTFGKSFAQEAPSAVGSGLGAAGGLALGGALAPETGGLSIAIPLLGMLLGGYSGSKATKAIQSQIEPDAWSQNVAASEQENPKSALLGGIATMPLAGFKPSVSNLGRAGGALSKLMAGMSPTANEANALINVGFGAGLPAVQSVGESLLSGKPMPSVGNLALSSGLGALFSEPNAIGRSLGFHSGNVIDEPTHTMLRSETPRIEVNPRDENGSIITPPPQQFLQLNAPSTESKPIDVQAEVNPVNQEASSIRTPKEEETANLLKDENVTGENTPEWFQFAKQLGLLRNIDLREDGTIINTDNGKPVAGQTLARQGLQEVLAKINPEKAGADTPYHELAHTFINDLRSSNRGRDRQFVKRFDSAVESSLEYQSWSQARRDGGLSDSIEEYQATNTGVEAVARAMRNEAGMQKFANDFGAYLKTRFGEHGTPEDFQRILNYKLLHDPSFNKIFGSGDITPNTSTTNQEESSLNKDKARYDEIQARMKDLIANKQMGDEFQNLWKESEGIKNKYQGFVPGTGPTKNQEGSFLNDKQVKAASAFAKMRKATESEAETNKAKREVKDNAIADMHSAEMQKAGIPINQEESSLLNPRHEEVRKIIDHAVAKTDDASITAEDADEIQNALATKVDWGGKSRIKDFLNSEKFDSLDPDHWATIKNDYLNAYPAESANKNNIEVPRNVHPKALEETKSAVENIQNEKEKRVQHRTAQKENKPVFSTEPIIPKEPESKPNPLPNLAEERTKKEHLLAEAEINDKEPRTPAQIKAEWDALDSTINPTEKWRSLQDAYEHTDNKEKIARATLADKPYDKDSLLALNKALNRKTTLRMQMDYIKNLHKDSLGDKQPPTLNSEESALNNRAEEMREVRKQKKESLDYSTIGFTRPLLDVVRQKLGSVGGNAFADTVEKFLPKKDNYYGKYMAPILESLKGLSTTDKNKIHNVLIDENADKKSYRNLLTEKQQKAYDTIRETLNQKQKDQIEANQPVTAYKGNTEYKRLPKVDPFYYPNRINPEVIETLTEHPNTQVTRDLKNDFLEYQDEHDSDPEAAQAKLDKIIKAYDIGKPNMTRFNAVREQEGVGLPKSWMREGLEKNLSGYFNRVASDRAFHDTFETNPKVAASLGYEKDPWGNPLPITEDMNINKELKGSPEVKQIMDSIAGEAFHKDEAALKATNRVATSLFLGPLTNLHIAASSVANSFQYMHPSEVVSGITYALTNMGDSYGHAIETGYLKKDFSSIKDLFDVNTTGLEKLRSLSSLIGKLNGRDLTNNFTKSYLQGLGEYLVQKRAAEASTGDTNAKAFMKRVDPSYEDGKTYTTEELEPVASNFANIIHGAHDARTLPGWMLRDTAIQPFFQLASWNISQTNAWMRHVWTPAKNGNFTPLIMSTLGATLGGYLIKQARETLADKKSPIPSLTEMINSDRGLSGNIPLAAYNLMAMQSFVGFAGILSTMGKAAGDIAFKNIPQGAAFPLDEVMGDSAHRITQVISALMNDPHADYFQVGTKLLTDLAKENIQLARVGISWAARNQDLMPTENYLKNLNAKNSDLRRWQMVEGMPYEAQSATTGNPYMSSKMKEFKRTSDIGEAASLTPELVQAAIEKADGNPEVLKSELEKLKQNSYQTMPDYENKPLSFARYMQFIGNTQGEDEANNRMLDFLTHKSVNKAKNSLLPSF